MGFEKVQLHDVTGLIEEALEVPQPPRSVMRGRV